MYENQGNGDCSRRFRGFSADCSAVSQRLFANRLDLAPGALIGWERSAAHRRDLCWVLRLQLRNSNR